jgi:hypothetical protein
VSSDDDFDRSLTPWPDVDVPAEFERAEHRDNPRGGVEFTALHATQRLLQDRLAGAALPPDVSRDVTVRLEEIAAELADYQMPEPDRIDGWRADLPGRGHPLLPPYLIDDETDDTLAGRVTFTRFYLGGNGAAHGGSHPLLFDDVLGRVMNHGQPGVARTAYLKVNYRRVTPLDIELRWEASRDRVEGRKRWGSARLFEPSGALVSDAETLFLQLLPGQA